MKPYSLKEFSRKSTNEDHSFRIIEDKKRGSLENLEIHATTIFLLTKGELLLSFDININQKLTKGQILLIPPGSKLQLKVQKDIHLIVCHFESNMQFYENFRLDHFYSLSENIDKGFYPLTMNEYLTGFLTLLKSYMAGNLMIFNTLNDLKKKELLLLLQLNYTNEELTAFFLSILSKDIPFKELVLKEYPNVSNVKELAEKLNYSLSGFKKKFEQSFGQTAYSWMQEKRADIIFRELTENQKPIKEIIYQYKFSSLPRFYEFCKRHYGKTPKKMQKMSFLPHRSGNKT